ncbi:MAG: four helix bundle protein [Bacteroidetes bacterium]|nr:four helix bundle protein [Bacteroidota bacterium]
MAIERKNINRGYKKLEVWQDAIELYLLACKTFCKLPNHLMKVTSNSIDASHSISRNISEGYCRRGLTEYLNFLNYSLGSCGEFHSCYYSCYKAKQISENEFEELDALHYKVENKLIKLIESLQRKKKNGEWEDSFVGN